MGLTQGLTHQHRKSDFNYLGDAFHFFDAALCQSYLRATLISSTKSPRAKSMIHIFFHPGFGVTPYVSPRCRADLRCRTKSYAIFFVDN